MKGCDVMPNWTHNKIICKKSIAEKLLTPVEDTYVLDFKTIKPYMYYAIKFVYLKLSCCNYQRGFL